VFERGGIMDQDYIDGIAEMSENGHGSPSPTSYSKMKRKIQPPVSGSSELPGAFRRNHHRPHQTGVLQWTTIPASSGAILAMSASAGGKPSTDITRTSTLREISAPCAGFLWTEYHLAAGKPSNFKLAVLYFIISPIHDCRTMSTTFVCQGPLQSCHCLQTTSRHSCRICPV